MSEKMMKRTDEIIAELVRDKVEFQKAYNYYAGIRDEEQFKYIEENFGIGSPTSVKMTPMVKKHIDALIGEYLGTPILPKPSSARLRWTARPVRCTPRARVII